jgi:hypothetical protein
MRIRFLVVTCCLLAGCASDRAELVVYSQPEGAYITNKQGQALGVAPVTIYWMSDVIKNYKDKSGCYLVGGVDAQWVSGARATTGDTIRLCGESNGSYNQKITRNSNDAGLDKDLDFAMKVNSSRALQQQSQASQDAVFFQMMNSYKK